MTKEKVAPLRVLASLLEGLAVEGLNRTPLSFGVRNLSACPGPPRVPTPGPQDSPKPSSQDFMERLEEQWRKRQDGKDL